MRFIIFALLISLTACQSRPQPKPPQPEPTPVVETDPVELKRLQLVQDVDALLKQKYIDPLTRFIESHNNTDDPLIQHYLSELQIERQKRCKRIAGIYAQRPKTQAMLKRLRGGYQYSCPDIVSHFAKQVTPPQDSTPTELADSTEAPEALPETDAESVKNEATQAEEYAAEQTQIAPEKKELSRETLAARRVCQQHYKDKHYVAAVQVCESPAQAGDALSQYHLGMIFRALKSYSKALFWLKKSAEQRFVEADFELGQLYRLGLGVTSDMTSARMWYQRAASRHKHQALYYLGLIAGNVLEAYAWFNLAAQAGIAKAADKRDELHQGFNENQRQAAQKLSLALYRELK